MATHRLRRGRVQKDCLRTGDQKDPVEGGRPGAPCRVLRKSVSGGQRVWDGRLTCLRQKPGDGRQGEDWSVSRKTEVSLASQFPFYCIQATSLLRVTLLPLVNPVTEFYRGQFHTQNYVDPI